MYTSNFKIQMNALMLDYNLKQETFHPHIAQ